MHGIAGPVGLGFRVPCLLMSPFTKGGFVATDVFDHTSTLRFIETRFGVEVPNLSAWRRSVTGDMTTALALGKAADTTRPKLPVASLVEPQVDAEVIANALLAARSTTRASPTRRRRRNVDAHPGDDAGLHGAAPVAHAEAPST